MVGFRTKNSIYYIDPVSKTCWGGKFRTVQHYLYIQALIGERATIQLADGRVVWTSKVIDYV